MKKGQSVKIIVDYDLFGTNVNGCTGIFLKTSSTEKHLVCFPDCGEWGEFEDSQLEVVPGPIPLRNIEFANRTKTLEITY